MQVDKDTLIKHRFWIGLGVAVPLILIAYLIIITSVSGKIDEELKKVDAAKKALEAIRSPKNGKHLTQLEERLRQRLLEAHRYLPVEGMIAGEPAHFPGGEPEIDHIVRRHLLSSLMRVTMKSASAST